jgi:hypothetical protein
MDISTVSKIGLDLTSVLTLARIDLLEAAINGFDEVTIASSTLSTLFEERAHLHHHQPSMVARAHRLLKLVEQEKILSLPVSTNQSTDPITDPELACFLHEAKISGGYIIHTAPIRQWQGPNNLEVVDPSPYKEFLVDLRSTFNELAQFGLAEGDIASKKAFIEAHDLGFPDSSNHTLRGATVYIDTLALHYLDEVDLLSELLSHVGRAFIADREIKEARNLVRSEDRADDAFSLVEKTREILSRAIRNGKIQVGSYFPDQKWQGKRPKEDTATMRLISIANKLDAVIVDDRWMQSFQTIPGDDEKQTLIASTLDVLRALKAKSLINEDQHFSSLRQIRDGGAIFVPPETNELSRAILASPVRNGTLIETRACQAIRYNFQRVSGSDILRDDESLYLLMVQAHVISAIRNLWIDEGDEDVAMIKSEYLLDLLPDLREWLSHENDPERKETLRRQYASQLAAISLPLFKEPARASSYAQWIEKALIQPLKWRDPEIIHFIAEALTALVTHSVEDLTNEPTQRGSTHELEGPSENPA